MAWRDSRTSRRKMLLFSGCIVLGIAALTAIGSLGNNLERAIGEQAKALLGADLVLAAQHAFSRNEEQLFEQIGGEQAREVSLSTMIYFPRSQGTRLVQLRALAGAFPFYGRLEAEPASAAREFGQGGGALVEGSLLTQFEAKAGDSVRLGNLTTRIVGQLKKVPGETIALATIAPRVYLPMKELSRAGLLGEGGLARYRVYFKLAEGTDVSRLLERLKPQLDQLRLAHDTVAKRQRDLGRSMDNLYHFLNLVGFIALLLGGVGVASAIHVHVKQKLGTVAVLRCLGGSVAQTFAIYLAQGIALGLFGAVLGAALGVALQAALPAVLKDFIPFTFQIQTSWLAVGRAMAVGFLICVLFALLPLLTVRRVSPLAAFQVSFVPPRAGQDPLRWLTGACLAAGITSFALAQSRDWRIGLGCALGLGAVFALLAVTAKGLMWLTRSFAVASLPFALRQGVANLHRPNNRTLLVLLAIGLGTFLMLSLYLVQQSLLDQLVSARGPNQPNAVLFDIQKSQKEAVIKLVRSFNLPVLDEAPIVTMRLSSVKGRSVESLLADKQRHIPPWTLRREYRSSYNDQLRDGEKIIAGQWVPRVTNGTEVVPISLEQGIAGELQVGLGDEMVFDVQGLPVTARVASLREVDWRRIQPNFFVVFPRGVLEEAPAMRVVVTRVASSEESARLQRQLVNAFPNVLVIDLTLIVQTLETLLGQISFVIRFMAMFTVLTGLLVLAGVLITGRDQRVQESVLLRTLGASRGQVSGILAVEYLSLGLLAALTAIVLAVLATWALAGWVFHVRFTLAVTPLFVAGAAVPALTLLIGLLVSRGVSDEPPLAILRAET